MTLLNGYVDNYCKYGAAYSISGNVVYLTGFTEFGQYGFNGEIAVLPPAARPSHYLHMIAYNDAPGPEYVTLRIGPDGSMYLRHVLPPSLITANAGEDRELPARSSPALSP
jgi:hypothetical protein